MGGNSYCAIEAKACFLKLGVPLSKEGKYQGSKFDSCSVFQRQDDIVITRVSMIDFFDPDIRIVVHDFP